MKTMFFALLAVFASAILQAQVASAGTDQVLEKPPVMMDEFRVEETRLNIRSLLEREHDWFKLMPFFKKDAKTGEKVIDRLILVQVRKDLPAGKAGLRDGMMVHEIQGVKVQGLTQDELRDRAEKRPGKDTLRFLCGYPDKRPMKSNTNSNVTVIATQFVIPLKTKPTVVASRE